jgi:ATP-dependent Clp protease ATP-binding subunit ClpA
MMFERFTREAREVVMLAEQEAVALHSERIGAEHLLVSAAAGHGDAARVLGSFGLGPDALRAALRERPGGLDAAALAAIGIDLDEVRRRVEESFGPGALTGGRAGRPPFSPGAKKALELGLREALALGDRHIGTEHVLLGVLRDPDAPVAAILRRRGQDAKAVRAALLAARPEAA